MSATLSLGRLPPSQAAGLIKAAATLSRSLTNDHIAQSRTLLQSLLSRIEIGATTLTLTVALGRLREALGFAALDERQSHIIVVPFRIAKRGIEQKLVMATGSMAPGPRDDRWPSSHRASFAAILEGRQPADLNLKRLMYRTDLSSNWNLQRQQLGFEP